MRSTLGLMRGGFALTLAVALAACGSGTATPGATATGMPAPTPSPSPTPAPTPSATTPSGWDRIDIPDKGFSVALPPDWQSFDLSSGDLEQVLSVLDSDPQLQDMKPQIQQMMASGGALFAVSADTAGMQAGFLTNMNVIVQEGSAPLSLVVASAVSSLKQTLDVEVEQETVSLPAGPGARLSYEPTIGSIGTYHVTQYIVASDDNVYIVSFARLTGSQAEAKDAQFAAIMETFALLP